YDRVSYLCCQGNSLRVAWRGVAERRRPHGPADGSSINSRAVRRLQPSGRRARAMRKEPAMGELKKRGKIWWIRYYKNGRRHEESSGSTKEGDAKSLLRLREGDIERGVAITPKVGRIRFDEAAKDVINDYRTNRKRSLDDVERRIEMNLKPFFGNRRMASVTTADIREYIDSRQKETTVLRKAFTVTARDGTPRHVPEQRRTITGVSNAEINRELTALKRMFNLAIQAGKLIQTPHIPLLRRKST